MKEETWETVQIRTFTNWINSRLEKGEERQKREDAELAYGFAPIEDLTEDLKDGIVLIALIYSITGVGLACNKNPKMKVHKRENIDQVIGYLKKNRIETINIGSEDIEQGSKKLTLALVWRLIIAFSLEEMKDEVGSDKSLKERLLAWCRERTAGYAKVEIRDFEASWRSGLALSALVHSEIGGFEYDEGSAEEIAKRALRLAKDTLRVPALIGSKDLVGGICDEKSVITYLVGLYGSIRKREEKRREEKRRGEIERIKESLSASKTGAVLEMAEKKKLLEGLGESKKRLDEIYFEVARTNEESARAGASYVLQADLLRRLEQPWSVFDGTCADSSRDGLSEREVLDAYSGYMEDARNVGVLGSLALKDSLIKWGTEWCSEERDGEEGEESEIAWSLHREAEECRSRLVEIEKVVTFMGRERFVEKMERKIEEALRRSEEERGARKENRGKLLLPHLEKEEISKIFMVSLLGEIGKNKEQFRLLFAEELKKEKELLCRHASENISEETPLSLPKEVIPAPSAADIEALESSLRYLYVVSESVVDIKEGNRKDFIPISLSTNE